MASKPGRLVTYLKTLLPIKSHGLARLRDKFKTFFILTVLITTKLGRIVNYSEGLLAIKLYVTLIMSSCENM